MQEWVENLEIDVAGEPYKPYDATVADRIGEWADEQGYAQPAETAAASYGSGWWKYDTDTAAKLLEHNGYTRDGNGDWYTPEGERFSFSIQAAPDEVDSFRVANAAADMWNDFGIDVELQGLERSVWSANFETGQFETDAPWLSFVLPDGDGWPQMRSYHSKYYVPAPELHNALGGGTPARLVDPVLDELIDAMESLHPQDPQNLELGAPVPAALGGEHVLHLHGQLQEVRDLERTLLDEPPERRERRLHAALLVPGRSFLDWRP